MSIILRKIGGRLTPMFRGRTGPSFGSSAPASSVIGFFTSALMLLVVALALCAAWALAHPTPLLAADHVHQLAIVGMASPIVELRAKRTALVKEANTALDAARTKAKAENRALTAEELAAQDAFDVQIKAIETEEGLEQRKLDRERTLGSAGDPPNARRTPGSGPQAAVSLRERAEDDPRRGFATHREFLLAVLEDSGATTRADVTDERLRPLAIAPDKDDKQAKGALAFALPAAFTPQALLATVGSDEQGTYDDRYGGFAVPTTLLPGVRERGFEGDPTAGRTQPVPMATPSIEMLARVDSDHTSSVSGGFTVSRRAETAAMTATREAMEKITMKANSLFGLAYATEEILTDSPISFVAIIDSGFRTQFGAHMLNEKLRGLGGSEYGGVLNAPCLVTVAKEAGQAADTIVANNIINMAARCWGWDQAFWLANHDTRPQLAVLNIPIGTSGVLLYHPSTGPGFPDMLWGKPVMYTEFASKLGDVGDLLLGNWSQYLDGLYQPLQSAESVHVRFLNHERAFKFWLRNAGAPWWRAALTPAKSAVTLSPFVTLAAR